MKNLKKRITIIVLCVISFFVVSCREEIIETTSTLATQVAGDNYRGINVKTDARYGIFLSFKSEEQIKKFSADYLDELSSDELLKWSASIGHNFISQLVISQDDYIFASETAFADPSVAAILNKSGYLMVAGQMYRFYDQIGSYEIIDVDGTVKEKVQVGDEVSLSNAKVTACKAATTKNVFAAAYSCPWSPYKEYHIKGSIVYTKPWIGKQKIVLKTYSSRQPCGTGTPNPYAANNLGAEVSYNLVVDGVNRSGSVQSVATYNNNEFSYTLASGSDICLGFVIANHFVNFTSSIGMWSGEHSIE